MKFSLPSRVASMGEGRSTSENPCDIALSQSGPARLCEILLRALPALMTLALLSRSFNLSDIGWQLKLGEQMIAARSPAIKEHLASLHIGEPIVINAWLAQIIYAAIHTMGGWKALRIVDALLWLGGLFAAVGDRWLHRKRPLPIIFALGTAFIVALPSAGIRPQSFASLAFGLFLVLLKGSEQRWSATLFCIPLLVVWQNLHPSVPLAFNSDSSEALICSVTE